MKGLQYCTIRLIRNEISSHRRLQRVHSSLSFSSTIQQPSPLKVLLLQPPGSCKLFTRSNSVYPPLGLCQLASTVSRIACQVFDAEGLNLSKEETINHVTRQRPACVGFTVTTMTMRLVNEYATAIKTKNPNILVMAGGPQATAAPDTVLQECPSVDAVFRGEGELGFPTLVSLLRVENPLLMNLCSISSAPGIVTRDSTSPRSVPIQRVPASAFVGEQALPFPILSEMPMQSYWCPDALRSPMVTFMTARGCPFKCAFCATPQTIGNDVRGWDPVLVAKEVQRLVGLGVREVSFVDDLFTAQPSRVRKLCEALIENKVDVTWFANSRADRVNAELCSSMKRAGCHQIFLGVESGSPKLLKYMKKGETVETMIRGAGYLREAGINISTGFIIGLPGETDETVAETIELAKRLRPNRIQFSRWTPLAGSALVEHPDRFATDPRSAPALEKYMSASASGPAYGVTSANHRLDGGTITGAEGFHGSSFRVQIMEAASRSLGSYPGTSSSVVGPSVAGAQPGSAVDVSSRRSRSRSLDPSPDRVDGWIARWYSECSAKRTGEVDWGKPSL